MESVGVRKKRKKGDSLRAERKRLRAEGKSYVNTKKKLVEAKPQPQEEFSCKCKFKTCALVPHKHRTVLFQDFYALKDNEKQNSYLMGLITITPVKRRRHGKYTDATESRRQATVCFSLPDGGGDILQVCKNLFMHVFAVGRRRIETLVKAKKKGDVVYTEKRGNKSKKTKYSAEDQNLVIQHVNDFPRELSHYGRKKSSKEYLSQDLNILRLYRAFKLKYPNTKLTSMFYRRVFKQHFPNISFHRPRSDTCSTCDLLFMKTQANPNDRQAKTDLEIHHLKAEKARVKMKEDMASSQLTGSDENMWSVDLEQVFSLPSLTHGEMFYLRQLSCYNLGIHVGDISKGLMFLWHEGMSGRGSNDIASCLLKATKDPVFKLKKKLIVWSDNCSGQNKNQMLVFLFIWLVLTGVFDEIHHKFLVPGHSYLPCDRDLAQIEKRKRVEKCEVPKDLVRVIVNATPNNPFIATMLQPEDFFDLKTAATTYLNTSNLQISKLNWIKVNKENPGVVFTRRMFNELEEWKPVKVFKKNVTAETIKSLKLPKLPCVNHIAAEKKADIRKMLPYVKEENREFFTQYIS